MRPRLLPIALMGAMAIAGCGSASSGPSHRTTIAASGPPPSTDPAAVAARDNIPVLCYHQVRPLTSSDGLQARPYIVSPAVLHRQLRALWRAGYQTVTGDALVAHVARGAPLPPKPVLITFDDASEGQFSQALPLLRRYHFVATFFVMTVVLDKPGWLSRSQVRTLDRAGMTIAAHTWDHHPVTGYTAADWPTQIDAPTQELATLVGHPIHLFAYPYGLWSSNAFPHLQSAGFAGAFQLADRLDRQAPLWTLRRIIVPEMSGAQLLRQMRADF